MSIQLRDGYQGHSLDRVLEDVLVRFVLFAQPPEEEPERIFFDMELALWFFIDLVRTEYPQLQNFKIKGFCKKLAELCPFLWEGDIEEGLKKWSGYKSMVPVRGVALFDKTLTKIMLVQGTESRSWSFPRGKIEQGETDAQAAIREASEEVGLDVGPYLNEKEFIERTIRGKNFKIFLCKNVPDDVAYRPNVRNEINSINWKNLKSLVRDIKKSQGNYFLVSTMIGQLSQWASKQRGDIDEQSLKLEVEEQLKQMLGIGEQPVNDPGRELLDILRQSTAKKQAPLSGPVTLPMPHFPTQPFPGFAFHPPSFQQFQQFQQLQQTQQFNSAFAPPILPLPGMGHPQQPPPFVFNPMFGHPLMQRPPVQQPPNISQLQRPSLSMRNDVGSAELLGLLNRKAEKKPEGKSSTVREESLNTEKHKNSLLALLGKTPDSSDPSKDLLNLLKKEPSQNSQPAPAALSHDSSANLMALLKSKKAPAAVGSPDMRSPLSHVSTESPKKIKILKRNESLDHVFPSESVAGNQRTESERQYTSITKNARGKAPKNENFESRAAKTEPKTSLHISSTVERTPTPSRELLNLIKQSRAGGDDDAELFEDFTDDEFDEHSEGEPQVNVASTDNVQPSYTEQFIPMNEPQTPAPPVKFKILKRGETLDEPKSVDEPTSVEVEQAKGDGTNEEHHGDVHSSVSTIDFSDDSDSERTENEEFHDSFEAPNADDTTPQPVDTTQLENLQAKTDILGLLHGPVSATGASSSLSNGNAAISAETSTSSSAREDLLGLLHKNPDQASSKSTPPISFDAKPDNSQQITDPVLPSETLSAQNHKPGADLLNILHKSPASTTPTPKQDTASHDLLSMLHGKTSPTPATNSSTAHLSHESGTPATGLMSLLHKKHASAATSEQSKEPEQQLPAKHSKTLLNLLFKR